MLALDFVGAFDTFATAVRDSVVAVGQPLLDSLIWRNQKALAVQTALQAAVPQALIDSINGFLVAGNGVVTSLIVGTQNLVAAILTFNLGNIIDAAVDGTRNFIVALGAGAEATVGGIEAAQLGIATALATPPPPTPVADTSALSGLALDKTLSPASTSRAVTLDTSAVVDDPSTFAEMQSTEGVEPAPSEESTGVVDVAGAEAETDPQNQSETPTADSSSPSDISHDATAPAAPPEPVGAIPDKDVEETVKKDTTGVENGGAVKESDEDTNDAGTAAKPASEADDQ